MILISGPSGLGYAYPEFSRMTQTQLDQYVTQTEDYTRRAGLKVIKIWNTNTGGIKANVGSDYASKCPDLLGLTTRRTLAAASPFTGAVIAASRKW